MSYSDDFAGVDSAGAPLDPTIMIGADPMFWGAIGLALVVAALVGWLIGAGSRSKRTDAAHAIWEAIDDAAKAAMKADTDVFTTFEGDNTVLLQLVSKGLLTSYRDHFGDLDTLGERLNLAIYRMAQEALTNVSRHAQAGHVSIRLSRSGPSMRVRRSAASAATSSERRPSRA